MASILSIIRLAIDVETHRIEKDLVLILFIP